jgi:hypothetical protein
MQSGELYKSFHPLWCCVWLMSLWEMISHPSRCELTLVMIDAVVWARMEWWRQFGFRQVTWLVMLESAKDRILGVDHQGQYVPPCVRYGTACLLIRYAIDWVSCSVEWDGSCLCDPSFWHSLWTAWTTWCKWGHFVRETSTLQVGPFCEGIRSKAWHTPVVGLCNGM